MDATDDRTVLRRIPGARGGNPFSRRLRRAIDRRIDPDYAFGLRGLVEDVDVVVVNESHLASSAQVAQLRSAGGSFQMVVTQSENIAFNYDNEHRAATRKAAVHAAADLFLARTPRTAEALQLEGVPADRIVVQPFGVDTSRFDRVSPRLDLRQSWKANEGDVVFVYLGRLLPEKGLVPLLSALARARPDTGRARLAMVGSGGAERQLRRAVSALGLDDIVTFTPWVAKEDVPAVLASADVLAMPSLPTPYWEEQLGYVLIEAMAAGLPILSTLSGSMPFVVSDAGLLVEPYDVDALARAIRQLASDSTLRHTLGERGRSRARSDFDLARVGEGLASALRSQLVRST
ncbi:glycosyltransferase family 4 protein [Ornithinimicrobium kibberense]